MREVDLQDFVIFRRFNDLSDSSIRQLLLNDGKVLLDNKPSCLLLGCGFGYFQAHYGYPLGLYPHNLLLEAVIVWGLPLTTFIGGCAGYGFYKNWRYNQTGTDAFVIFFLYSAALALKSGTLLSEWVVMAGILKYVVIGIGPLKK